MPAKTKPDEVFARLEWLKKLPDEGKSWGKGLIETGKSIVSEVEQLEKAKEGIVKQIHQRLKVLRALPGRAEREAPLMFTDDEVKTAKMQHEVDLENETAKDDDPEVTIET